MKKFFSSYKKITNDYSVLKNKSSNENGPLYLCNEDAADLKQQIDRIYIMDKTKIHVYPKHKNELVKGIIKDLAFFSVEEDSYVKNDLKYTVDTKNNCIVVSTNDMYRLLEELCNLKCLTKDDLKNIGKQFTTPTATFKI